MHHFEAAAIEAAREAGTLVRASLGAYAELNSKLTANDLVTDVDRASERLIARRLLTQFPDHALLGEEGVNGSARTDAEYTWIVDPIDGTMNFVHGIPFVSISIALARVA
jgi:myo-inositol-1(or 4)-monophosphatase